MKCCVFFSLVLFLLGCSQEPADKASVSKVPKEAEDPLNVLLILFDTLRPDFTEPYGALEGITPNLKKLAGEGITFQNISSPSSFTPTAIGSMYSSLPPWMHAIHGRGAVLPADQPYLPSALRDVGYKTVAVIQNPHLSSTLGFARGFDDYQEIFRTNLLPKLTAARNHGPRSFADFLWDGYLSEPFDSNSESPVFVYLHLMDPHSPYDPPPPYDTLFYSGNPPLSDTGPKTLNAMIAGQIPASDENLDYLRSQYRGEIAYMDATLGFLLKRLNDSNKADRTLVVFLSDHGEEFWEHQGMHHWRTVHEEVLYVPFIFRFPDGRNAGRTSAELGSLTDFPKTLLAALGIETEHEWKGENLFELGKDPERAEKRLLFAGVQPMTEPPTGYEEQISVRKGPLKLIASTTGEVATFELFHLDEDPGETRNLVETRAEEAKVLFLAMDRILSSRTVLESSGSPSLPASKMDAETISSLESLGYFR